MKTICFKKNESLGVQPHTCPALHACARLARSPRVCVRARVARRSGWVGWCACWCACCNQALRSSLRQGWAALFSCAPRLRCAVGFVLMKRCDVYGVVFFAEHQYAHSLLAHGPMCSELST